MRVRLLITMACLLSVGCAPGVENTAAATDKWPAQVAPHSLKLTMPEGSTGFYKPTKISSLPEVNLKTSYGAIGDGKSDESQKLQKALYQLSKKGGGRIYIPKGIYMFSGIKLPSNTHIEIEAGTIIRPVQVAYKGANKKRAVNKKKKPREASITIFDFGKKSEKIENVSITGKNGSFSVELHKYEPGIIVFGLGNVQNFQIANVTVKDALTKFSAITMGAGGPRKDSRGFPTNGYVANFTQIGAHYGYGVVQTQAAQNVLFENLHGEGGAVLRFETGFKGMNDDQFGGIANLIGKNISCKDGNAAVMISPHAMHNGVVAVDGVRSDGCGFAVRVGYGYVAKKYSNPNLEGGSFAQGTMVSNIYAKFGKNAQLKSKHYKYMPEFLLGEISPESEDGESHRGPAISPVLNIADFPIEITNVSSDGFVGTSDIATEKAPRSKNK